jgi:hypothetical protein
MGGRVAATHCFLRSFETRRIARAGATAALAMRGTNHPAFLIASLLFAALCHPQRRAYLASRHGVSRWIACS